MKIRVTGSSGLGGVKFRPKSKMRAKITAKQKSARRKNIAVARAAKKKGSKKPKLVKPKGPKRGAKRPSGMSARMEHELHRFTTMTDKQLRTRLGKITKPKKLKAFIQMAKWTGKKDLGGMAKIKLSHYE